MSLSSFDDFNTTWIVLMHKTVCKDVGIKNTSKNFEMVLKCISTQKNCETDFSAPAMSVDRHYVNGL